MTTEKAMNALQHHVADHYTPVFPNSVRTVVYVAGLIASVIGLGCMTFGYPDIGGFISTAAGIITGGMGVAYNPISMAARAQKPRFTGISEQSSSE